MRKILLPPVLLLLCLIGIWVINRYMMASRLPFGPLPYAGALVIGLGVLLPVWGTWLFRRAQTNLIPYKSPEHMVTGGPFSFSRNPMYLGMTLVLIGASLIAGTWESLVFPALYFAVANWWYIPFEEVKMANVFGEEFTTYKARVRRWI